MESIEFSDGILIKIRPDTDSGVIALQGEITKMAHYAEIRVIATDADVKTATEDLSLLAKLKKAIADKRKDWLTPIKEKLDAVDAVFRTLSIPLDHADKLTRTKILAYRQEQEEKIRKAEEINRLRMEAAKKEMELKGEVTEPINLIEQVPAPPKTVHTEVGNLGTSEIWKFEVVDFALLPSEYKIADEVKIGKVVRATKGSLAIPGVKMWPEKILKVNAK